MEINGMNCMIEQGAHILLLVSRSFQHADEPLAYREKTRAYICERAIITERERERGRNGKGWEVQYSEGKGREEKKIKLEDMTRERERRRIWKETQNT